MYEAANKKFQRFQRLYSIPILSHVLWTTRRLIRCDCLLISFLYAAFSQEYVPPWACCAYCRHSVQCRRASIKFADRVSGTDIKQSNIWSKGMCKHLKECRLSHRPMTVAFSGERMLCSAWTIKVY